MEVCSSKFHACCVYGSDAMRVSPAMQPIPFRTSTIRVASSHHLTCGHTAPHYFPCRYFLPPIIFYAGLSVKKKKFFRNLGSIATLGILGTYILFAVIAFCLYAISMLPNLLSFAVRERTNQKFKTETLCKLSDFASSAAGSQWFSLFTEVATLLRVSEFIAVLPIAAVSLFAGHIGMLGMHRLSFISSFCVLSLRHQHAAQPPLLRGARANVRLRLWSC